MLDVSLDEVMSENFADGKRKGKSPGRVKNVQVQVAMEV